MVLLCSACLANAQEEPRTITFSTISTNEVPQNLWYESAGQLIELKAGGEIRGATMSYTGTSPLGFFRLVQNATGELTRVPQARAVIPDTIDRALLCFFPASASADQGLPWNVYVMDDSLESFAGGNIRFVNLTNRPVIGVLDDETMRLEPGANKTLAPQPHKELGGLGIKLAVYLGEKWEPFFSARWPYRENIRLIVIFLVNQETQEVEMKAIPQNILSAALAANQNL